MIMTKNIYVIMAKRMVKVNKNRKIVIFAEIRFHYMFMKPDGKLD